MDLTFLSEFIVIITLAFCLGVGYVIKTSLAFSDSSNEFDYLKRLYNSICKDASMDLKKLQQQGFSTREIEILTGISKSQVARELKENVDE